MTIFQVLYSLLSHLPIQIADRKNTLEMELNESLRRRRDEIRGKLESLSNPGRDNSSALGDFGARQRELKLLQVSIDDLGEKITGSPPVLIVSFRC